MNLSFESVSQLILCSVEETEERSTLNNAEKKKIIFIGGKCLR